MNKYSGPAIDGPDKGKLISHYATTLQKLELLPVRDDGPPQTRVIGAYRWHEKLRYWQWVPA